MKVDINGLVQLALSGSDDRSVALGPLDDAEIPQSKVLPLGLLIGELVDLVRGHVGQGPSLEIRGSLTADRYTVTVATDAVGIGQNSVGSERIQPVKAIADSHGMNIHLAARVSGTEASVSLPVVNAAQTSQPAPTAPEDEVENASQVELSLDPEIFLPSESIADATERFLEEVFGPLRDNGPALAGSRRSRRGDVMNAASEVSTLPSRKPGEHLPTVDDEASTAPGESAVDTFSALSQFELGRDLATKPDQSEG